MHDEREKPEEGEQLRRSFSATVRGGKTLIALVEKSNPEQGKGEAGVKEKKGTEEPEIRLEKLGGIHNFVLNDAALEHLRKPWWEALIVRLLGRKISLLALTRSLEAMWSKQGSIEVVDIGNDFFIVRFYSQEDLDFTLTGGHGRLWTIT
ncbi:hypothetical protein S245_069297 [Arachis hypogaea]